jgi:hypothetical protein
MADLDPLSIARSEFNPKSAVSCPFPPLNFDL